MLESDSFVYVLIAVGIGLILYFTFKTKIIKPDYFKKEYWNRRYECYDKEFDWYADANKAFDDFSIHEIISKCIRKTGKILELGCGSSTLSLNLAKKGYTNIVAIDYSEKAISIMTEMFYHKNVTYIQADFFNLVSLFKDSEFDLIIEKAGLDTILTLKDQNLIITKMQAVFMQLYKVLKPGGRVLTISNNNPQKWKEVVHGFLEEKKMFVIENSLRSTFTTERVKSNMNYYFYQLRKI